MTKPKTEQRVNQHIALQEEQLGIPSGSAEPFINPLQLAIQHEFKRGHATVEDYRDRALDRCIERKINFTSECNSQRNLVERLFSHVNCPYCRQTMKLGSSSGTFNHTTYDFKCGCGVGVSLSLSDAAIKVGFPEPK